MAMRIIAACGGVQDKTIGILGLTFKPETDDMRESPSIPIIDRLVDDGAIIRVYDPKGMAQAAACLPDVIFCEDAVSAAQDADALVLVTEWNEFRAIAPDKLLAVMRGNVLIDLRNVYDPQIMQQAGFDYHSLGQPGCHKAPVRSTPE